MTRPYTRRAQPTEAVTDQLTGEQPVAQVPNRRRRNTEYDRSSVLKLGVDESKKDPKYSYRWVREGENGARMAQLFNEDWDKVLESEVGQPTKVAVGTQKDGRPEYAYLCKKRKEFVDEDAREKHERSQERLKALRRGVTGSSDALSVGARNQAGQATSYIPDEGITISD